MAVRPPPQQPVPVELDLNDVAVPLTAARALGLQAELYSRFSSRTFQSKLNELRKKHGEGTMDFRKARQQLVLDAQREVLPKYGYQPTPQGVADMRSAVKQLEKSDPEVLSNTEVIDHLLGDGDAAWMVAHAPEVSHLEDLSHHIVPSDHMAGEATQLAVQGVGRLQGDSGQAEAGPRVASGQEGIGVELDLNDVKVPLTKDRVLALQAELIEAFGSPDFQDRLHLLEVRTAPTPSGAHLSPEYRKARQLLALEVQSKIIPKYGYEATLEGVAQMLREVRQAFGEEPEVKENIATIDRLLAAVAPPRPRTSPRRHAAAEAEAPAEAAAASAELAVAKLSPREPRPRQVVHAAPGDGYWIVVGGRRSGGLRVRLGEDMTSLAWPEPLECGAVVKLVQRSAERMHYEKVAGRGPNYGWVSIHVKDHDLLEPFVGDVELGGPALPVE